MTEKTPTDDIAPLRYCFLSGKRSCSALCVASQQGSACRLLVALEQIATSVQTYTRASMGFRHPPPPQVGGC